MTHLRNVLILLGSKQGVVPVTEHLSYQHARKKLLPLLELAYDKPRVRFALSRDLGNLIEAMGGSLHAHCLLPLLEKLVKDDTVEVSNEALKSMKKVAAVIQRMDIDQYFSPIIRRLSDHNLDTARAAAIHLIAICYRCTYDFRTIELKRLYCKLGEDDSILVRQAAATQLIECIKEVNPKDVEFEWHPLMISLTNDNADAVRADALAANSLWKDELDWNHVSRASKLWIWTGKCHYD